MAKIEVSTRHRSRLRSLLHEKIATQRVKLGGGGDLRVPYRARGLIEGLRARHFLTLRVEEVAMALTMPGDVARLPHLGYAQTNESAAFCGSGLLEYFCDRAGIRQIHQRHDNRIDRLAGELLEIRRVLWPRGDEDLRKNARISASYPLLQYKKEGLEATFAIFGRCLGDTSVNPGNLLREYDDSVQYMSILQERSQEIDRCLPSYDFTLLTPKHLTHAPIFRCIARYHNMTGAGEGSSKRGARNRAAFELSRALGDDRNHEKSAAGGTSGLVEACVASLRALSDDFGKVGRRSSDVVHQYAVDFVHACISRMSLLGRVTLALLDKGDWLVAAMTARGFIETIALLNLFLIKYKPNADRSDRKDVIVRFAFSTRSFADVKRGIHINDALRELEKNSSDVMVGYEILCEAVHPNWLGVRKFSEGLQSGDQSSDAAYALMYRVIVEACTRESMVREFLEALDSTVRSGRIVPERHARG